MGSTSDASSALGASRSGAPAGAFANSSDMRCRRRSMRISPTPSAATLSRTRSYVRSSPRSISSSAPAAATPRPSAAQGVGQLGGALGHLDDDELARRGDVGRRGRAQQPPAVDDHDVVAHPLELAEQVRGDQDGDAELRADPPDEAEHVVAAGRVEAVRRLVQQHELRVVHERLRELHPLLHAGRVAADGTVALLVQADVPQRVGRALASRRLRQPGHARHVDDELGRRHVRREAVVLRHVPDPLADRRPVRHDVEAEDRRATRPSAGSRPEHHLDQRRLARAVRADQPDDARLDLDAEVGHRRDLAVPLGQPVGLDQCHLAEPTHYALRLPANARASPVGMGGLMPEPGAALLCRAPVYAWRTEANAYLSGPSLEGLGPDCSLRTETPPMVEPP